MSTVKPIDRDALLTAVEAATWAPSIHNSQPWRFEVSADAIEVYADRSRWLHAVDTTGRELTLSCGAALEYAVLGLRGQGYAVEVAMLPTPADKTHLARIKVTGTRTPTETEHALVQAIPIRYTDRGVYDAEPLPTALVDELRDGVAALGAWLRPIVSTDDAVTTAVLLGHAYDAQQTDPAYIAELNRWSRYDEDADDGIPRRAVSEIPVEERASMYRLRDFDVDGRAHAHDGTPAEPPAAERPFVCLLGTAGDDPPAWLDAGRALAWLLLRATVDGVAAQPMTQPLEVAGIRARLTQALGLVGHPQMLLRMGHGSGTPTTHRRPVNRVVDLT